MHGAFHDHMLHIVIFTFDDIKYVKGFCRRYLVDLFGFSEMIYTHIVCNTHRPLYKLTFVIIFIFPKCIDYLNKYFLKEVFSCLCIFDKKINGGINLILIPV